VARVAATFLIAFAAIVAAGAVERAADAGTGCTRYASPSGNDRAAGTAAHPLKTVQRLIDTVPVGGTACLTSGATFSSRVVITKPVRLQSTGTTNATLYGGITIAPGADGTSVSGLTIHGRGAGSAAVLVEANDVHVVRNAIDGIGYVDLSTPCVTVDQARGVVIDSNTISTCTKASRSGLTAPGIYVWSGYGTRISNNLITHTVAYGIILGPNAQHSHVTHDIIDSAAGGIFIYGNGKFASSYNVIEDDILSNLGGHAVLAQWGGLTGKNNAVFSTCVWHAFGGTISAAGVAATGNMVANPHYKNRPTDYTITGGACSAKHPSIVGVHFNALPKFALKYSVLGLPAKVRMDALSLNGIQPGDSVVAACTRLCNGSFKTTAKSTSLALPILQHQWVKVGSTIDVRVTKPGYAGAWARITVTGLPHGVSIVHGCLEPGSTIPVSCGAFG
jgi:hypothetical protein